jgi:hypothetical protein
MVLHIAVPRYRPVCAELLLRGLQRPFDRGGQYQPVSGWRL